MSSLIQYSFAESYIILTEEFPPYNYQKDGKIHGISTEITREILKRLEQPDNIQIKPWAEAYNETLNNDNTILFSTTRTAAREEQFKWVGPLVPNNTAFFAKKAAAISINNLDDAKKLHSIGVYKKDFGGLLLNSKGFKNLDSVIDNRENIVKLMNGQIDLWIINEITGKHMLKDAGLLDQIEKVFDVQKDYMYLAFHKNTADEVIVQWQTTLDEIKSDGTYAQIFSSWIMFSYSDDLKPKAQKLLKLSEQEILWIKAHPTIRVATDPDYAPFQFTDLNANSQGLANDYLKLIEKKLGLHFELLPSKSWNLSLEAVKNRKADMVAVAAKTTSRQKYMSFTSPYVSFPDVIITRKNIPEVNSIVELYGKTLASIEGFAINTYIIKYYPTIKISYKNNVAAVLKSVSMGESDATVLNVATASYAIEEENITNLRMGGDTDFAYQLAFASRNDWPSLNILLEKALLSINDKERKKLLRKWVSVSYIPTKSKEDNRTVQLTEEEKTWLKEHPIITAAPDPDWSPVEFFDAQGKYSGITADYIALLEKRLGIKFHMLRLDNWEEILQKVIEGKIDMLTAASITSEREKKLIFTKPYLKLNSVIVVNTKEKNSLTMDDLNGKVVTIVAGYANQEYMQREYPDIHLKEVANEKEGLQQVAYGKAYAYVGSIATTSYIIEKDTMVNLRFAGDGGYQWNLAFASHKDSILLNQILTKGLASISKEEQQNIFSKWVFLRKEGWRPSKEMIIAFFIIAAVFFVISIIIWNRMLAKKVKLRTLELNETLEISERLRKKADKAHNQAIQANLAKSRFFAAASHDLRQPLHALGLLISALKQGYQRHEKAKDTEIFALIDKSLSNQKELFSSILDASKLEAGAIKVSLQNLNCNSICQELENEFTVLANEKSLVLKINVEDDLIIYSDELILKRILKNLLSNAIRYTQQGEIKIEGKAKKDKIILSVSDSGPGISKHEQENVFKEFYQISALDNKSESKNQGLGLGLSIVSKLAALLNTKISLISEAEQGCIFSIILPKGTQEEFTERRVNQQVFNSCDLSKTNILVIDDDEDILKAMKHQLNSWECTVNTFTNHFDSLDYIRENKYQPDLIIIDYRLENGIKGTDVISEILSQFKKEIPVVFISADISSQRIEEIKKSGYQLLHKPVRPAVLRLMIQKQLKTNSV